LELQTHNWMLLSWRCRNKATNRKTGLFSNPSSKTSATPRSNFSLQTLKKPRESCCKTTPQAPECKPRRELPLQFCSHGRRAERCSGTSPEQRWVSQPGRSRSSITSAVSVPTPSSLPCSSHPPPRHSNVSIQNSLHLSKA